MTWLCRTNLGFSGKLALLGDGRLTTMAGVEGWEREGR